VALPCDMAAPAFGLLFAPLRTRARLPWPADAPSVTAPLATTLRGNNAVIVPVVLCYLTFLPRRAVNILLTVARVSWHSLLLSASLLSPANRIPSFLLTCAIPYLPVVASRYHHHAFYLPHERHGSTSRQYHAFLYSTTDRSVHAYRHDIPPPYICHLWFSVLSPLNQFPARSVALHILRGRGGKAPQRDIYMNVAILTMPPPFLYHRFFLCRLAQIQAEDLPRSSTVVRLAHHQPAVHVGACISTIAYTDVPTRRSRWMDSVVGLGYYASPLSLLYHSPALVEVKAGAGSYFPPAIPHRHHLWKVAILPLLRHTSHCALPSRHLALLLASPLPNGTNDAGSPACRPSRHTHVLQLPPAYHVFYALFAPAQPGVFLPAVHHCRYSC